MTNIWIKRNKEKNYTLEISKNAMIRFSQTSVKKIDHDKVNKKLVLNLDFCAADVILDLANIMDDIRYKNCTTYYGKLRTFRRNGLEVRSIDLKSITEIKIDFLKTTHSTDLILTLHYA